MVRLASNSVVDSSPGLKSQVSTGGDSDVENMGDPSVSQTNFATQIPYSPPKPSETCSPGKLQLLGKRKVMGDLRQLVNDSNRPPKKTKPYIEDKWSTNVELSMQTDVERGRVIVTSVKDALESEGPAKGQDTGSSMSGLSRQSVQTVTSQDLEAARDHPTNRQMSPPRPASNTISEDRLPLSNNHLDKLARWRDRLTKMTYLPRYLQTISKAQNDLLATDSKWQPALVGQPTRPGTLPLELLNSLTAAADQKAAMVNELLQSNQQASERVRIVSKDKADGVDEELDLPSNSLILEAVGGAQDQNHSEAQDCESESEGSSVSWSPSPPRSSPPRKELPPDSSPLQGPPDLSVPSPPAKGFSRPISEFEDPVVSSPAQPPSVKDVEQSSQASQHHPTNALGSFHAHIINAKTNSRLMGKPVSRRLSAEAGVSISQADPASAACSKSKSDIAENAPNTSAPFRVIISSDDFTKRLEHNNVNAVQVSYTPHTAKTPTSNEVQPHSGQNTKRYLLTMQSQPASQQLPSHSSPQLIPGTSLQEVAGSRLTDSLQDLHQPKDPVEVFEIDSSEDGSLYDADIAKSFLNSQGRDEQADAPLPVMVGIQSASQVHSAALGNLENASDGTTAPFNHTYSDIGVLSGDTILVASDCNSLVKHQLDNTDNGELSRNPNRASPTIASSVLSVSSEEPGFRRVDNMARQYRREVFGTRRRNGIAAPLPPPTVLVSNLSPQSENVKSSKRWHSAQTSILRQVTTSTPLTTMSAQAQKILRERPASSSDMSGRTLLQPEYQYLVFKQTYPTYEGNFTQFLKSCGMIKKIRAAGKMLPQGVWDDFVYRHHHDYRLHLHDVFESEDLESPMPYEEYYADCVSEPVHLKGVLRFAFIDALSAEVDHEAALNFRPARTSLQRDHPGDHRRSVAASSSASNMRPKEWLADRPDQVLPKNHSMALESHLQLKEQEEARQSQSSSVHLWLQKASGAASPELGTPNRLAAPDDIPCIDLTKTEDNSTFDLARELLPLTTPLADIITSPAKAVVEEARLPDAKEERFKGFAFSHAKLDSGKHGRSQIRTDAKGVLRPEVQKIIDIFNWRG